MKEYIEDQNTSKNVMGVRMYPFFARKDICRKKLAKSQFEIDTI